MYRSASNHHHFRYDCSFLLASLMKKTALDFLPNTLILFQASTIQNAPSFSAALKSDLLRDILEAQNILPLCSCIVLHNGPAANFYKPEKEGSFP